MNEDPLLKIGGTSLRVYFVLLTRREPIGVRELQHELGLSSPSVAKHHLDRLLNLGLIEKVRGGYKAKPISHYSILLSAYMILLGSLVPRMIPYALLAMGGMIAYIVFFYPDIHLAPIVILMILGLLLLYDGLRMLRIVRTMKVKR